MKQRGKYLADAQRILADLGMPRAQQNERSAPKPFTKLHRQRSH